MSTAHARIPTDRAGRYLTQLCRHTAKASALDHAHRHRDGNGTTPATAPLPRHAEYSDTDGVIDFNGGRCTLRATGQELLLLAEADDQQHLQLIQDALTTRLQQIGHRDQLTLTWRPGPAEQSREDHSIGSILEEGDRDKPKRAKSILDDGTDA